MIFKQRNKMKEQRALQTSYQANCHVHSTKKELRIEQTI